MEEIFCEKEVVQTYDTFNKRLFLKEDLTNQEIEIKGIPVGSILIKLDVEKAHYKKRSNYFNDSTPFIHKGCDYCLIIPDKKIIILFELKSEKPKKSDYMKQFIASEYFLNYCTSLSNFINKEKIEFTYKRILLSPRYSTIYTDKKRLNDASFEDVFGNKVEIKSPGFPPRINLEKLIY
jgi:hypothetical protein